MSHEALELRLSRRQQEVLVALYRGRAFEEPAALSVRALVGRRALPDSRYAGPLSGLEEAGLVGGRRQLVKANPQSFSSWWLTNGGRRAARVLATSRSGVDVVSETVRVLEVDKALGAGLDAEMRAEARERAVAETLALEPGVWTPELRAGDWQHGLGLLVLEGLISRQVTVKRGVSVELFGPGDLLRPWSYQSVPAAWEVLTATRLAVLDREFSARVAAWPELTGVLLDRAMQRSRSLAVQSAVRQRGSSQERLLLMLWHLAHRWGELSADGVSIRLHALTPAILARMAATTPASAARALERLQEQGDVERLNAGGWWLALRRPPDEGSAGERPREPD